MASITIRRLDEQLKTRLRVRASSHGRSMEEEVREILRAELDSGKDADITLAEAFRRFRNATGGIDIPIAPREAVRRPPKLK